MYDDFKNKIMDLELMSFLKKNREWAASKLAVDADYFLNLAKGQQPSVLWIGCSDSRVPPNTITGAEPGDLFIHRNIANVVVKDDLNLLSVLDYSVNVLKVKHIVICGHYGCGGVAASMTDQKLGIIDQWLDHIKADLKDKTELNAISDEDLKFKKAVEFNTLAQVKKMSEIELIQKARSNGQILKIHAWVFDITKGEIIDLN